MAVGFRPGLEHLEPSSADGRGSIDRVLEDGMVAPEHLLCPAASVRLWVEGAVAITR